MNPNDTDPKAAPGGDADQVPANDAAPGEAVLNGADPVAVLEAEKLDLKDKLLRTLADMDNLRRRTERSATPTTGRIG